MQTFFSVAKPKSLVDLINTSFYDDRRLGLTAVADQPENLYNQRLIISLLLSQNMDFYGLEVGPAVLSLDVR